MEIGWVDLTLTCLAIFAAIAAAGAAVVYGARFVPVPTRWTGPASAVFLLIFIVLTSLDDFEVLPFDLFLPILVSAVVGVVSLVSYNARRGEANARKLEARLDLKAVSTFPLRTFEGTRGPYRVRLVIGTAKENRGPYETLEISAPAPALGDASFRVFRSWQELPLGGLAGFLLPAPGPLAWGGRWKILSRPWRAAERLLRACPPPVPEVRLRFVDAAAGAGRLSLRWRTKRFEAEDIEILCARAGEWLAGLSQAPVI